MNEITGFHHLHLNSTNPAAATQIRANGHTNASSPSTDDRTRRHRRWILVSVGDR